MRITKNQLRKIIKEEMQEVISETWASTPLGMINIDKIPFGFEGGHDEDPQESKSRVLRTGDPGTYNWNNGSIVAIAPGGDKVFVYINDPEANASRERRGGPTFSDVITALEESGYVQGGASVPFSN